MSDFNPADHTIEEVKAHLDEHPEDSQAVLEAERARGDDARVTLVNALEGADGGEGDTTQRYRVEGQSMSDAYKATIETDAGSNGSREEQLKARFPEISDEEVELSRRNVDEAAQKISERTGRDFNEVRQSLQTTAH